MSRDFFFFIGIYPFRSSFSKRNDFFSQKDTVKPKVRKTAARNRKVFQQVGGKISADHIGDIGTDDFTDNWEQNTEPGD